MRVILQKFLLDLFNHNQGENVMRIYSTEDRIKIKVDGLVFEISPLSFNQKMEIQAEIINGEIKGDPLGAMKGAALAVKYAVKSITGLKNSEGKDYEFGFDDKGLTDESVDDLFNMEQGQKLTLVCLNLLAAIPKEFVDPSTGEAIEGVSLVKKGKTPAKK